MDYSKLPELTKEEQEEVIIIARQLKLAREEQERYEKEYWQKLTAPAKPKYYSAEELRNKLLLSKTAAGKYFTIDSHNQAQVNLLCLYFSGDSRLSGYGFSHEKGLLLMGGLGVGKTHLMSFFFQNQKASYVMKPCREIENKWVNAGNDDKDWIEYYSGWVTPAVNSDPYAHERLGFCFDDLGTETVPSKRFGEEKNVMSEIILSRYEKQLHGLTHITTNLSGQQIKELYGDRIGDRLKEMCNVIVFPEGTPSRRS